MLRVALPGAHRLELEQARPDVRVERGPLEPLRVGQPGRVDGGEPAREAAEVTHLRVNRGPAQVLEQVVVEMNAVERRVGGMGLVQPREILVDEMR